MKEDSSLPFPKDIIFSKSRLNESIDFLSGAVLLVDKPIGWTSFDVVNKIRGIIRHNTGLKKIKVGHAGTLDPLATGLLLICTGKLTKQIDLLQAQEKTYTGSMYLGATTPTYDSECPPDECFPIEHSDSALITQTITQFEGTIDQLPPAYSAIKVNGKAAYALARKGKDVELKPRSIHIHYFKISNIVLPTLDFEVKCSKGTYIRSLAHDLGKALNSGAYLASLRREAIGDFNVQDAFSVSDFVEKFAKGL